MTPRRVYVAGPYTKGDVAENVRNAVFAGDALLRAGHAPFIPHLTHFWHYLIPRPWDDWIRLDAAWVDACDAVVRLPGESTGADREVAQAEALGIPVFFSVSDFLRSLGPQP